MVLGRVVADCGMWGGDFGCGWGCDLLRLGILERGCEADLKAGG